MAHAGLRMHGGPERWRLNIARENRILKAQLNGRLKSDAIGRSARRHAWPQGFADVATVARRYHPGPYRKLVARKLNGRCVEVRAGPIAREVEQPSAAWLGELTGLRPISGRPI